MSLPKNAIRDVLLQKKIISADTFTEVEKEAEALDVPPERLLVSKGYVTQKKLLDALSESLKVPVFDVSQTAVKTEALRAIPEEIAREREVIAFDVDEKKKSYKIATTDPTNIENINFLKEYLNAAVEVHITTRKDLTFAFRAYKRQLTEEFEKSVAEQVKAARRAVKTGEKAAAEDLSIVKLFDSILDYAIISNASDVFFQPEETVMKIRFRIDGILRDIFQADKTILGGIVARAKALSGLRIDEHMKPQDGRFKMKTEDAEVDVRTAVIPTIFGEKVTLRLLASDQVFLNFEELGMDEESAATLRKTMEKPYGMILSAGPTGSGKTTTIYSILKVLNKPETHIVTIEDPVEYVMQNISQTQVNLQAGVDFASGLRAYLRHNPDIIFIGEIRDEETASVTVNAALTGHLLISTIHTTDAPSAVVRMGDLGVKPFLSSAILSAIVAQRLVRRICPNCSKPHEPSRAMMERIKEGLEGGGTKFIPKKFYKGAGCKLCGHSGYTGRMGIFEIMIIDEKIRKLINEGVSLDVLKTAARENGMKTMFENGLKRIEEGATTIEELLRVTSEES